MTKGSIEEKLQSQSNKNLREQTLRSCRICLMAGELSNSEEFICPCKCQGSLQYVHQPCIRQWVQKKIKGKQAYQGGIYPCQICKSSIKFNIDYRCTLNNTDNIKQLFEKNKKMYCLKGALVTIYLMFVVFMLLLNFGGQIDLTKTDSLGFILSMVVFVSFPITIIIMLIDFIYYSLLVKKYYIKNVQPI